MIWIETVGGIGAGKSTLAAALSGFLREYGVDVFSPEEAMILCFERLMDRNPQRLVSRLPGSSVTRKALRRFIKSYYRSLFSVKNPALIGQVLLSRKARYHLPEWHNRKIVQHFFKIGEKYEFFSSHLKKNEIVLFDEGFAYRAVNLFAWENKRLNREAIHRYLSHLPVVDYTIVIHTPLPMCIARAQARGLPQRLHGKDEQTIYRFFHHSHLISNEIAHLYRSDPRRRVIEVSNVGDLGEMVHEVYHQIIRKGLLSTFVSSEKMVGVVRP